MKQARRAHTPARAVTSAPRAGNTPSFCGSRRERGCGVFLAVLALMSACQGAPMSGREYDARIKGDEATVIRRIFSAWVVGLHNAAPEEYRLTPQELISLLQRSTPSTMRYLMVLGRARLGAREQQILWVIDQRVEGRR